MYQIELELRKLSLDEAEGFYADHGLGAIAAPKKAPAKSEKGRRGCNGTSLSLGECLLPRLVSIVPAP